MAKCRIGHFVEAQILESLGVDYIDRSEVLTPADEAYHINKHDFKCLLSAAAAILGKTLRRIGKGAAMMRTKGEPGTGDVVEAVPPRPRCLFRDPPAYSSAGRRSDDLCQEHPGALRTLLAGARRAALCPWSILPRAVCTTPADAALMMQLGVDGIFVGSGIFKSGDPSKRAQAIVKATTHYNEPKILAEVSP